MTNREEEMPLATISERYRVKVGDSLSSIAISNWASLEDLGTIPKGFPQSIDNIKQVTAKLAEINKIPDANHILPHQMIHLKQPLSREDSQTSTPSIITNAKSMTGVGSSSSTEQTISYSLAKGSNLTQVARSNWERLKELGTIPAHYSVDNRNHQHLAALKIAQLNGFENPNHVIPSSVILGRPNLSKVEDTSTAAEPKRTPPPAEEKQKVISGSPLQAETAPPNSPTPISKDSDASIDIDMNAIQATPHLLFGRVVPNPNLIAKASEESVTNKVRKTVAPQLRTNENGFVSFLILGQDLEGRPDMIKQVLIDPNTLKTAIIDIPRDIKIGQSGNHKLNSLGNKNFDLLKKAVTEVTGQNSEYVLSVSLNDLGTLKPIFSKLFPDGLSLPTAARYFHSLDGKYGTIFEPGETITDLEKLQDFLQMRHGWIVPPDWKVGDPLDKASPLTTGDMGRQKRQSELFSSLKGQISYVNALSSFPVDVLFKPEYNHNRPDMQGLIALAAQLKLLGGGIERFQPPIDQNLSADGSVIERYPRKGQHYSTITVDSNKLRQDVKNYFSS